MYPRPIPEVIQTIKRPEKVVLAVMPASDETFNAITLAWFMRTSINPPMYAISVGHSRYSYKLLQKYRFFNLCFPSEEMRAFAQLCGTASGRDQNKIAQYTGRIFSGKLANIPIFKEASANLECQTITEIQSGDHTIFVGEVKHAYLPNEEIRPLIW